MPTRQQHWDAVYQTKAETEVSWYQDRPERSLALIKSAMPEHAAAIIDIGGGASHLVDTLLAEAYRDVTVLDISEAALSRSKGRLGPKAELVSWLVADITHWHPSRQWQIWHDRAVFHFLTDQTDQDAYIAALEAATRSGSIAIISTFALDGPERCSGLPVQRYSPASLAARIGTNFALVDGAAEQHATPWGATQNFSYAVLKHR